MRSWLGVVFDLKNIIISVEQWILSSRQMLLALLSFKMISSWLSASLVTTLKTPEQAPRVDRPPPALCFATPGSLPATQGQRSKDWLRAVLGVQSRIVTFALCRFKFRSLCRTRGFNGTS